MYAFNHEEAINSFRKRSDSTPHARCATGASAGIGRTSTSPMDGAATAPHMPRSRSRGAEGEGSEADQGFIRRPRGRYGPDSAAKRPALDSAYATAMGALSKLRMISTRRRSIPESLMDLQPWDYYTVGGHAQESSTSRRRWRASSSATPEPPRGVSLLHPRGRGVPTPERSRMRRGLRG